MYIPKTLQEENVHSNYLMALICWTSRRVPPRKKNSIRGSGFFEFCMKSIGSSVGDFLQNFKVFRNFVWLDFFFKIDPPHFFEQHFEIFSNFV